MKQWINFESDDFYGNTRNLRVFFSEECDLVTFYASMKDGADFTREEARNICKEILKILEEEK
jgi:hypothetical protein